MIPIVAGLALGALMGGGIAALQKKDILQGALMGGIGGALGGAFMPGVAGAVGGEAVGAATSGGLGSLGSTTAGAANLFGAAGTAGAGGVGGAGVGSSIMAGAPGAAPGVLVNGTPLMTQAVASGAPAIAPAAVAGAGGAGAGGIGSFLSANKYALMGGGLGGMMAPGKEPDPADQGNIYTTQFSQEKNPLFGQQGQNYFASQTYAPGTYTKAKDYEPTQMAANGGIIALAEGGDVDRYERPMRQMSPEVAAYNAQIMERANQQYNVNPRPGPNQVPGSAGYIAPPAQSAPAAAPAGGSVSGLTFNPVTQKFEGEFAAPGDKKRNLFNDVSNEVSQPYYNHSAIDGGGNANGGLMRGYNQGGISTLGSYSDGGQLLKGPGDGVSDDIPARIGARQPARLADGEFVVPARIVSEIGNGSTDAGAKQLYAMMDRVQQNRKKTVGKGKVAVDAKSRKLLPA
jgi:hypothetical protein